jgi:hypothetical protein
MVAMEMKAQDFLFRQPAIKIVNAESRDIATTSTGKCSTGLNIIHYLPPFSLYSRQLSIITTLKNSSYALGKV